MSLYSENHYVTRPMVAIRHGFRSINTNILFKIECGHGRVLVEGTFYLKTATVDAVEWKPLS
jgi:hypothetical protein